MLGPGKTGSVPYQACSPGLGGHRLIDTVTATLNRLRAVERTLSYTNPERGREYRIAEGELPFFMHRERGMHLDERQLPLCGVVY